MPTRCAVVSSSPPVPRDLASPLAGDLAKLRSPVAGALTGRALLVLLAIAAAEKALAARLPRDVTPEADAAAPPAPQGSEASSEEVEASAVHEAPEGRADYAEDGTPQPGAAEAEGAASAEAIASDAPASQGEPVAADRLDGAGLLAKSATEGAGADPAPSAASSAASAAGLPGGVLALAGLALLGGIGIALGGGGGGGGGGTRDTADTPQLTVSAAAGREDSAIALSISAALTDTDGSETLSVVISGVPDGATLSAGTNNGNGSWTLTAAQLLGLTLTPPANSDVDFTLTVTAIATETGGGTASISRSLAVTVDAVADEPTLAVSGSKVPYGLDETDVALSISAALTDTDGSETLSVVISGVPGGATLSAGTNNGGGSWTLTAAQLTGLTLALPNTTAALTLGVTATATEAAGGSASVSAQLTITPEATGFASKDLLAGAFVFRDANGNLAWDPQEVSAYTDANGRFVLAGGDGEIIILGGVDTTTGRLLDGLVLRAPLGATIASPLTVLTAELAERALADGATLGQALDGAVADVQAAFRLPGFALLTTEPVTAYRDAAAAGDAVALGLANRALSAAQQVNLLLSAMTSLCVAANPGTSNADAADFAVAALADLLGDMPPGGALDLTDVETISALIAQTLDAAGITVSRPDDLDAIATFLAGAVGAVEASYVAGGAFDDTTIAVSAYVQEQIAALFAAIGEEVNASGGGDLSSAGAAASVLTAPDTSTVLEAITTAAQSLRLDALEVEDRALVAGEQLRVPLGIRIPAGGSAATFELSVADGDLLGGTLTAAGQDLVLTDGTVTLTGAQLAALAYRAATAPDAGETIGFEIAGGGQAAAFTLDILARPVNTAPAAATIGQGGSLLLTGLSVTDADATRSGDAFSVVLNTDLGKLVLAGAAGVTVEGSNTAALKLTGSLAAINAALAAGVSYTPPPWFAGQARLTMLASDGVAARPLADSDTILVTVTGTPPVANDAPTVAPGAAPSLGPVLQGDADPAGATIRDLFGVRFADPDGLAGLAGVGVIAASEDLSKGLWQFRLFGSQSWQNIRGASETSALFLPASAELRFLPTAGAPGATPELRASLVEEAAGLPLPGARLDLSGGNRGGATPYSAEAVSLASEVTPAPVSLLRDGVQVGRFPDLEAALAAAQPNDVLSLGEAPGEYAGTVLVGTTGLSVSAGTDADGLELELASPAGGTPVAGIRLLGTGAMNVVANAAANVVAGNAGANRIVGGEGADSLSGGAGADSLFGDAGADTLAGGSGDDLLLGGEASAGGGEPIDVAVFGTLSGAYHDAETDSLVLSGEGTDTLHGIERLLFDDDEGGQVVHVVGAGGYASAAEALESAAAGELLAMASGGQLLLTRVPESGADRVALLAELEGALEIPLPDGTSFDDTIFGGDFGSLPSGGTGDDSLVGGAGDDLLQGGIGDDTLEGAAGSDALDGGQGYDLAILDGTAEDYEISTVEVNGAVVVTLERTGAEPGAGMIATLTDVEEIRFADGATLLTETLFPPVPVS